MKKLSCVVKHQNCQKCYLVHSCPYGVVFESPIPPDSKRMRLYPQSPHPIRITVFPWNRQVSLSGDELEIDCHLFGKATTSYMLILMALEESLKEGIGRMKSGERGAAAIVNVRDILNGDEGQWDDLKKNFTGFIDAVPMDDLITTHGDSNVRLEIRTPLKLITNGRVNNNPVIRDILSNLMRRLSNMAYFFTGDELDIDYEKLLETASLLESDNEWKKIRAMRYSSRQEKAIDISGIIGNMRIPDCPQEILSLLRIGQYLGIGKNTSMGLGDYVCYDSE